MNDPIDRRAAIDAVKNADVVVLYHDDEPVEEAIEEAIEATKRSAEASIEGLPSAQAEIIHCGECIHAIKDELFGGLWCKGKTVTNYHYCGYAERRTDEAD